MDDQNVVGFYRHLLSLIPGSPVEGREAELAANLVSFICVFLPLRGWNLELNGPGRRGRGRRVPGGFHLPRSGHRPRSEPEEA